MQCRLGVLAMVAALMLGGCALGSERVGEEAVGVVGQGMTVQVENYNWADVTVYLLRGSVRARLGTVTTMGRAEFAVPRALMAGISDVRIVVDPIGSSSVYRTEPILVNPGQRIELRVENNINLTSYAVW